MEQIDNKDKQGISLIWVVIFCSLLTLVATIMTSTIVMESHLAGRFDASLHAYAAAKSGIAWGTYYRQKNASDITRSFSSVDASTPPAQTSYEVTIEGNVITSIGKANNDTVTRKLVYTFASERYDSPKVPYTKIVSTGEVINSVNPGKSFSYQYNTWLGGTTSTTTSFGIRDADGEKTIVEINPATNTATLTVVSSDGVARSKSITDLAPPGNLTDQYHLRVAVTYSEGIGVGLQIDIKNPTDSRVLCHKRVMVATWGTTLDFTDARFYSNGTFSVVPATETFEGTKITNGTDLVYINTLVKKGLDITP